MRQTKKSRPVSPFSSSVSLCKLVHADKDRQRNRAHLISGDGGSVGLIMLPRLLISGNMRYAQGGSAEAAVRGSNRCMGLSLKVIIALT